ncbi:MAG: SDR family oxidoreductase [Leptospiraceae bacterium]|nr:SDR family oxidoreductase [Leptospiraceae bacterium]
MQREIALITGASRGIGEAIAYKFAKQYELILLARSLPELEKIAQKINSQGGAAFYYPCDLADKEGLENLLENIQNSHGFVQNLILNAGVSTNLPLEENTLENIYREMEINYFSVIRIIKKFLPKMKEKRKGNIIAIGSIMGALPFPMNSSYAATKAALLSLFRSLRLELANSGVNVGIVLPGLTKTEMTKEFHSLPLLFESPEDVAQVVQKAIERRSAIEVSGFLNQLALQFHESFPNLTQFILKNGIEFLYPLLKSKH